MTAMRPPKSVLNCIFDNATLPRLTLIRKVAICSLSLLMTEGCQRPSKPLSPCRAQVVKDADPYVSQHVPDSQWQPIIEAEIRKCIDEEQLQ